MNADHKAPPSPPPPPLQPTAKKTDMLVNKESNDAIDMNRAQSSLDGCSHAIGALVRGIHDTSNRDFCTLHLPLVNDKISGVSGVNVKRNEMSPHASMPRLVVNIENCDDVPCEVRRHSQNNLSATVTDTVSQSSPGMRRLSHFNFAPLRRFSHAYSQAAVYLHTNMIILHWLFTITLMLSSSCSS